MNCNYEIKSVQERYRYIIGTNEWKEFPTPVKYSILVRELEIIYMYLIKKSECLIWIFETKIKKRNKSTTVPPKAQQ